MTESGQELQTLTLSSKEYDALDNIRGLTEDVHYMVVLAKPTPEGKWVLKGTQDTFEHFSNDLSEEIYEELSPKSKLKHLARIYGRLNPE